VTFRFHAWLLVATLIGSCVAVVGGLYWYRVRVQWTPQVMTSYLPLVNATVVYLDIDRLRDAGLLDLLAGSKSLEDQEYRRFVDESGFDYRTDLERVAIAIQGENRYFVVCGKFNWNKLSEFALHRGGDCRNRRCSYLQPDSPGRSNSFMPIRAAVLGLYTGNLEWGVTNLAARQIDPATFPVPDAPMWIAVPSVAWKEANLPDGAKSFASIFEEANSVLVWIIPESAHIMKLMADVSCADAASATSILTRLRAATSLLRSMLERNHQVPNPLDLSGLLAEGTFLQEGTHVKAFWPLRRTLLESIADGN
jgi:hypothetical protein